MPRHDMPYDRAFPGLLSQVTSSDRQREAINIVYFYLKHKRKMLGQRFEWYVDVSQCIGRSFGGRRLPCVTTSSIIFSFNLQRLLSPEELLVLMGLWHPQSILECKPGFLKRAVGEAMFVPNVASILLAFFVNPLAPWWHGARDNS